MNFMDLLNLNIQQQAAAELADQLRPGYYRDHVAKPLIEAGRLLWQQMTVRQPAPTEITERRWVEECQEWV